jgi:hypothetical protein
MGEDKMHKITKGVGTGWSGTVMEELKRRGFYKSAAA